MLVVMLLVLAAGAGRADVMDACHGAEAAAETVRPAATTERMMGDEDGGACSAPRVPLAAATATGDAAVTGVLKTWRW